MPESSVGEIVEGLWRFEAVHPEWTEDQGGEDGWDETVAWWAAASPGGLILIDPLVEGWSALDRLIEDQDGCAAVIRTCHWHQRSVAEAAERYGVEIWAKPQDDAPHPYHHAVSDRDELFDRLQAFDVERADEIALWLPHQAALLFGDAMIRTNAGTLQPCPESWTQPEGGPARLRDLLRGLAVLRAKHVLVSHGPLVLGDGVGAMEAAVS